MEKPKVLAIETSCDDTSVAIVHHDGFVEACLSANQDLKHKPFGGVVPEIASRNHTLTLLPLIEELELRTGFQWSELTGIAVTSRPGLIGSLLVGVVTAKTLAAVHGLKLIGVNHLEAHLLAPFLYDNERPKPVNLAYPFLALAVSGGHTQIYDVSGLGSYKILGRTLDDAAGEALDKFAKHLGLGFPGGVIIDQKSKGGDPNKFAFPRTMRGHQLDFSFSGLKSAAIRIVDQMSQGEIQENISNLCASYQEAVVDCLLEKLELAAETLGYRKIVITGGVSANTRLRERAQVWAEREDLSLFIPPIRYCTDNAAMVGFAGIQRLLRGENSGQDLNASASDYEGDFIAKEKQL